jgi:hypothetical protein
MCPRPRNFAYRAPTLILLALVATHTAAAQDFDEESYAVTDLDAIYAGAPTIDEGMDLFFRKVQFVASLDQLPQSCAAAVVPKVFTMLGLGEAPAVNHCLKVRSLSGRVASLYVEDVVVEATAGDLALAQGVLIYAAYLWWNGVTQQPGMLVTGVTTGVTDPPDVPGDGARP